MTAETIPYVDANKQLRDSHITRTADTTVITSNLQVEGNIFVTGTRYFVNSEETVINDRIIGLANNNTSTTLDIGLMLQYPQKNVAMIHHGTTSGSPHNGQLTLGYTQSGFEVDNITKDPSNNLTLNVWGHIITQNNITVGTNGSYYGDGTTLTGVALSADLTDNVTRIEDLETATIISNSSTITTGFTRGDIIYASADNVLNKLPLGTSGQVLKSDGTDVVWGTDGGGSGSTVWQQNGNKIYYSADNVGINVSDPAFDLDVHGTANVGALTATSLSVGGQTLALASDLSANASRLDAIYNGSIGDIIYVDGANSLAKLGIGSSGQVLKVSAGGVPEWANESGGGGGGGTSQWTTVNTNEIYYDGNVGIANTDPGHDLSVGSNLYVDDDGSNVLVVTGNTAMSALTLGEVSIAASYNLEQIVNIGNVTSNTVQFSNAITSLTAASNVVVGGNVTADHFIGDGSNLTGISSTLQAITDNGNVTSNTIQFSNAITGLVTTANVEVGGELTVSGNVEVGTANLFVDTVNSRIGVGTTSPQNMLHVYKANNDETSGILIEKASGSIPTAAALFFGVASTTETNNNGIPKAAIFYERNLVNGRGDLKFCNDAIDDTNPVSTAASDTRMIIKNSGEIGIGTVSPNEKLHVNGNIRLGGPQGTDEDASYYIKSAGQIHINSAADGTADDSYICLDLRAGQSGSNRSGIGICGAATSQTYQHVAFETTDTERMRINYDGNVGIGKTSPSTALDVNGIIKQTGANWALTNGGVSESLQYRGAYPGDFAYLNRTLSTPTNVTLTHENQGGYNTRSRITIGTTGKYAMYINGFRQTGTSSTKEMMIYKNGAYVSVRAYSGPEGTSNYATAGSAYTIMDLNANDYVEVYIAQGTYHGNDSIYFAGHLIA